MHRQTVQVPAAAWRPLAKNAFDGYSVKTGLIEDPYDVLPNQRVSAPTSDVRNP
ncbi:hypothetical protein [Fodinicola feengrottensis]|uniref:hypothetical protein n=1 Tax=Fodinicola feengrottensis TaxID=435914 RepID=UPI0013CFD6A4|nr:hypothetical protein [Fodinicola feengrottensis]